MHHSEWKKKIYFYNGRLLVASGLSMPVHYVTLRKNSLNILRQMPQMC